MILTAFTLFHVAISLAGIGAGLVIVYGMLTAKRLDGLISRRDAGARSPHGAAGNW